MYHLYATQKCGLHNASGVNEFSHLASWTTNTITICFFCYFNQGCICQISLGGVEVLAIEVDDRANA